MSMEPEDCWPGRRVAYQAHPGAPIEEGEVQSINRSGAFVLYDGTTTAKLTPYDRLTAAGGPRPSSGTPTAAPALAPDVWRAALDEAESICADLAAPDLDDNPARLRSVRVHLAVLNAILPLAEGDGGDAGAASNHDLLGRLVARREQMEATQDMDGPSPILVADLALCRDLERHLRDLAPALPPVAICPACEGHGCVATPRIDMEGFPVEVACPVCNAPDAAEATGESTLRAAIEHAALWHDAQDKALSKQPPSGDSGWRRSEHQEQAQALRAALAPNRHHGAAA